MTIPPSPIAMAIISEQRREEQVAQANRYRLTTLAQETGGIARRQCRADRHAVAAMIAVALALVTGHAADVPAPPVESSHVHAAHVAAEGQASDVPYVSAVQKVRESAS